MPTTRSAVNCHPRRDDTSPPSPTYQIAAWRSPQATAAATTVRPHITPSCRARAAPYFGGFGGGGPPANRCWKCPSIHLIV